MTKTTNLEIHQDLVDALVAFKDNDFDSVDISDFLADTLFRIFPHDALIHVTNAVYAAATIQTL